MASYPELRALFSHSDLRNQIEVACIIAAESIRTEDPITDNHANRLIWAKRAFQNPNAIRNDMLMALLAANAGVEPSAITNASDATVQAKVDDAVDLFADGS